MVKILGIFAILYVYCEIEAEAQKLQFWSPTTPTTTPGYEENRRSTKKKLVSNNKTTVAEFRKSRAHIRTKSLGFRAEMKDVKHNLNHRKAMVEPWKGITHLMNSEDRIFDTDDSTDKMNRYKIRDLNKYNDLDKDHNLNRNPYINKNDDTKKNRIKDKKHNKDNIDSVEKDENQEIIQKVKEYIADTINSTERDANYEKQHKKNKNLEKDPNKDKYQEKHNIDKNQKKRGKKDKNLKKDPNKDENQEDISIKDKYQKKNLNEKLRTEKSREDKELELKKSKGNTQNTKKYYTNKEKDYKQKKTSVERLTEDKNVASSLRSFNPEPIQGRKLELINKWPARSHRAKKIHQPQYTDGLHIRSTRLVPLSLKQHEHDAGEKKTKSPGSPPSVLSPYAIMEQMKLLMENFPEANATIEKISRTVEYNDIVIVKIIQKKADGGKYFRADESKYMDEVPEKKIIFIVHGLSVMGMKKLTPLVELDHFKLLLSYYLKHLDKFDIFLIPMANPDGYSISHSDSHSIWNKNVSPQEVCLGVCLDRNFDVAWNETRKISPCSQLYPGSAPFSEPESRAVREVFHYFGHKILAYIHVHSGTFCPKVYKGDAVLYPRGYSEAPGDDDKYLDLRGEIDEAMKNASFQIISVSVETLYNWYGKTLGSSVDYAASIYGIPYALEFVMQLYEDAPEKYNYYSLTEIWSRIIETTFNNMWKSLHVNEVNKK